MTIAERTGKGDPRLPLAEQKREERMTLELGGDALFVDTAFILSLRPTPNEGKEFAVTRDIAMPISVQRRDGQTRTYGTMTLDATPVFETLGLGFRPSRPTILLNNGFYTATFIRDTESTLTFSLVSKGEAKAFIENVPPIVTDLGSFMRERFEKRQLYLGAREEDLRRREEEQARKYIGLLRSGKPIPQEWSAWARRHKAQIQAAIKSTGTILV